MPATVKDPVMTRMKGLFIRIYSFEGYRVTVRFVNDRSGSETFEKTEKEGDEKSRVSDGDRDLILLKNLGPGYEVHHEKGDDDGVIRWLSTNGNTAYFSHDGGRLSVHTAAYGDYLDHMRNGYEEEMDAPDPEKNATPEERERFRKF